SVDRLDHQPATDLPDREPPDRRSTELVPRTAAAREPAAEALALIERAGGAPPAVEPLEATAAVARVLVGHRARQHALAGAHDPEQRSEHEQLEPAEHQADDAELDRDRESDVDRCGIRG